MTKENPLKQFFRRPAVYLTLPSKGEGYEPDVFEFPEDGNLPVYPMTAIDEITSRTPDALYNGVAVTDIIKSCIPSIKKPWAIQSIDLDAILIAIRIATNGDLMEIETPCPKCTEVSKFDVNLTGLLSTFSGGNYKQPMSIAEGLLFKFQPLNYKQISEGSQKQFEIQRKLYALDNIKDELEKNRQTNTLIKELNTLAMLIMLDSIEYIKYDSNTVFDKNFIGEFLNNCSKSVYQKIREKNGELRKETELKPLKAVCLNEECKHEYEHPFNINISDFFD